jgi:hypothetical protein
MILVYFALSLRTFIPYIAYNINYHYISTVLCENKGKPQMHCNGKCHLNKELKKAAQGSNSDSVDFSKLMLDIHDVTMQNVVFFSTENNMPTSVYSENKYCIYSSLSTPPPQV